VDFIIGLPTMENDFDSIWVWLSNEVGSFHSYEDQLSSVSLCRHLFSTRCMSSWCTQDYSFLIEDLSSRLVSRNVYIRILVLTYSVFLRIIHKPSGRLSVLIKFLKTCLELALSLAKVLGRNGCLSRNSLITTVIKRVSRWLLLKLYMGVSVGFLWTGWNLEKEILWYWFCRRSQKASPCYSEKYGCCLS
jgi:hypothetical protein